MLTNVAAKRLVSGCRATPIVAPALRGHQVRLPTSCAWSKKDEVLANWDSLREAPQDWYDNRRRKTNPKAPDFVRRDDRNTAIWIDGRDTPQWADEVLAELDTRQSERQAARRSEGDGGSNQNRQAADLEKWMSLRDHPEEWYDNRDNKNNPRAPDFKRRDNKTVALWLDSNTMPPWGGEVLQMLDDRKAQRRQVSQDSYREERYQQSNQYMEYEQRQGQNRANGGRRPEQEAKREAELANWEALRANPADWFDNRFTKPTPRQPDFRNKQDRSQALWLSSYDKPEWVDQLVEELDARQTQRSNNGPSAQQRQRRELSPEEMEARRASEAALWESLRDHPEDWYDNRTSKTNPKQPDFRRRDRAAALWVTSYGAPPNLNELLAELDHLRAQRSANAAAQQPDQGAAMAGAAY